MEWESHRANRQVRHATTTQETRFDPRFSSLTRDEVLAVLRKTMMIQVKDRDIIIRTGLQENFLVVILSGRVQVVSDERMNVPIATISSGDFLGEVGFLTRVGRTRNVVAIESSTLLVLNGDILDQLIESNPIIGRKVFRNLSQRLAAR